MTREGVAASVRDQERLAAFKIRGAADKLASQSILVERNGDNVSVTVPIQAWRDFWKVLDEMAYGD